MPQINPTQPSPLVTRLEEAVHLAKSGHRLAARDKLRQIVALQPVNQAAWLWLSAVAAEKVEAETALAQARQIDPAHPAIPRAEAWLAQRFSPQPTPESAPPAAVPTPPSRVIPPAINNRLKRFKSLILAGILVAMLAAAILLGFGVVREMDAAAQTSQVETEVAVSNPEVRSAELAALEEAWLKQDWPQAIKILEAIHRDQPDSERFVRRLGEAYWRNGLALRHEGLIDEAHAAFEQVLALDREHSAAQQEIELASLFLEGKQTYQQGHWAETIAALERVYDQDSTYPSVKDLLFSATYNHGLTLQAQKKLSAARETLAAAIELRPDLVEPRLRLAEVEFALSPETPPAVPIPSVPIQDRLILVGIAEQRMHVYEGDKLVYDFIVSTGEPGRPTAIGEFEILNKIDVAYASTWNLDMPNWLGIYWAGPLQNGIHSLPTVKHTGQTLWDGYLGQRVSYGCVILGHEESATLYEWAEVGTKVKIVPSLADYWEQTQ